MVQTHHVLRNDFIPIDHLHELYINKLDYTYMKPNEYNHIHYASSIIKNGCFKQTYMVTIPKK